MKYKETVNSVITVEDINSWEQGDIITISAGLGSGKSYFIKNGLYDYAKQNNKRILMLIHRINCVTQFEGELKEDKKTDIIDIKTYQYIESGKREVDLSKYDYIVCDEHHYFFSDSDINNRCDISLERILSSDESVRIFMSATGDLINRYLKNYRGINPIEYNMDINFDYINSLTFYNQDVTVENIIDEKIKDGGKVIAFIDNIKKATDLHRKYRDISLFNCGESNKSRYVDNDKIAKMLKDKSFEEDILITTSVMEAGVSIEDTKVKTIILDVADVRSLVQCMGRRRITVDDPDDKIDLYIKDISKVRLEARRRIAKSELAISDYLIEYGQVDFTLKYGRDLDNSTVYAGLDDNGNTKFYVNYMARFKKKIDVVEIDNMKARKNGYKDYIKEIFMMDGYDMQEKMEEDIELERYLESRENDIMLNVPARKELVEMVNVRNGDNNRLIKGKGALNDRLEESGLPFKIVQFRTSRMENGIKKNYDSAWKIISTSID